MEKKQFNTRLGEDLAEPVESYAKRHDVHASDGVRHYVRKGIDADRQPATDGGQIGVRFSFIELITVTAMLATAITYVLEIGTPLELLVEALALTGVSAILLAVLFGQKFWDSTVEGNEVGR